MYTQPFPSTGFVQPGVQVGMPVAGMPMGGVPMGGIPMGNFREINRGNGISQQEYQVIVSACQTAYSTRAMNPSVTISQMVVNTIKQQIGGEWFCFVSPENLQGYDFSLSVVRGNDFMSFCIDNQKFQICRLRN